VGLLDLILPPACVACGRPSALLCDACRGDVRLLHGRADDQFVIADPGVALGSSYVIALGAAAHAGPVRRGLAALKYEGTRRVAPILADLASPTLGTLLAISGPAALIPVPVHADRLAARGYNQAELLARPLAAEHGLALMTPLQRTQPTERQHRLDRAARLRNIMGAFAVDQRFVPLPHTAILLDDILTTGATLEVCAGVLRRAGVSDVYGFAIAREV
jgi:ComF family protein